MIPRFKHSPHCTATDSQLPTATVTHADNKPSYTFSHVRQTLHTQNALTTGAFCIQLVPSGKETAEKTCLRQDEALLKPGKTQMVLCKGRTSPIKVKRQQETSADQRNRVLPKTVEHTMNNG